MTNIYTKIKRGVQQGYIFSINLFSLYNEIILKKLDDLRSFSRR